MHPPGGRGAAQTEFILSVPEAIEAETGGGDAQDQV
jgi:hypothetical protein